MSGIADSKRQVGKKQREICHDGEHFCQNSDMQRGIPAVCGYKLRPASQTNLRVQKLEIRRGAYGLGAFAVEFIRRDQFIGGTVFYLPFLSPGVVC
jgi:hypothetical protein